MLYGLKFVFKYLAGLDRAERNFTVFPDDTMLVSYPRSGNTWARFLIANLLYPEREVSFTSVERLIPDTSTISSRALKRIPRPRVIKSHEYFDPRYPRVIYIVRDPRDVALSFYHLQRKYGQIADGHPMDQYVDDFVDGRLKSADLGTWGENVSSWFYTRGHSDNFLLLRFEDMLQNTRRELLRIADFMGLSTTETILQLAIDNSSSDRMRKLEQQQQNEWIGSRKYRKEIPFVRTAKAGNWQNGLSERSVMRIEAAWGDLMNPLGYRTVTSNASHRGGSLEILAHK
jgi:hypothetical protein